MSLVLLLAGGFISYLSWRMLLHVSDEKVNRHIRHWWTVGMSDENAEGSRVATAIIFAVFMMIIGNILLLAGVARLFGLVKS